MQQALLQRTMTREMHREEVEGRTVEVDTVVSRRGRGKGKIERREPKEEEVEAL